MSFFLLIRSPNEGTDQTLTLSGKFPQLAVPKPPVIESEPTPPVQHPDPDAWAGAVRNRSLEIYRRRAAKLPEGRMVIIEDWPWFADYSPSHPSHLRFWKDDDGNWRAEFFWPLESLHWRYHWERRYLRQTHLAKPLTITIAGKAVKVKRPTRISVHDHHVPGLQHLASLLQLSDTEFEKQAPLMNIDGGGTFKPNKVELQNLIAAERADHKLAHEKSAALEGEIDYLYGKATDQTATDSQRKIFDGIFRGLSTAQYFAGAPYPTSVRTEPGLHQFPILQTPPPSPPPVPPPAPDAPSGAPPTPPAREG